MTLERPSGGFRRGDLIVLGHARGLYTNLILDDGSIPRAILSHDGATRVQKIYFRDYDEWFDGLFGVPNLAMFIRGEG
jgi:hypothetical protein